MMNKASPKCFKSNTQMTTANGHIAVMALLKESAHLHVTTARA